MPFAYVPDEFHPAPLQGIELKILRHLRQVKQGNATDISAGIERTFAETIGGIATLQANRFVEQVKATNGEPKNFRITVAGLEMITEETEVRSS